jgi:hypothetical protein
MVRLPSHHDVAELLVVRSKPAWAQPLVYTLLASLVFGIVPWLPSDSLPNPNRRGLKLFGTHLDRGLVATETVSHYDHLRSIGSRWVPFQVGSSTGVQVWTQGVRSDSMR